MCIRDSPYRLYNIGNQSPVRLMDMIRVLEKHSGMTARLQMLPMQPGDVPATYADASDLQRDLGFTPKTTIDEGVRRFVEWYRRYYNEELPEKGAYQFFRVKKRAEDTEMSGA